MAIELSPLAYEFSFLISTICKIYEFSFFYINHLYNFRVAHVLMLSCFSHVQLFVTLWTVAHQAPLSMDFSRQEYWSG